MNEQIESLWQHGAQRVAGFQPPLLEPVVWNRKISDREVMPCILRRATSSPTRLRFEQVAIEIDYRFLH